MSERNAWDVGADSKVDDVVAGYRDEIAKSAAIIASSSLDDPPAWWPEELFGSRIYNTVPRGGVHVIIETATHAGQLDAVRELIDGKQWLVLSLRGVRAS